MARNTVTICHSEGQEIYLIISRILLNAERPQKSHGNMGCTLQWCRSSHHLYWIKATLSGRDMIFIKLYICGQLPHMLSLHEDSLSWGAATMCQSDFHRILWPPQHDRQKEMVTVYSTPVGLTQICSSLLSGCWHRSTLINLVLKCIHSSWDYEKLWTRYF